MVEWRSKATLTVEEGAEILKLSRTSAYTAVRRGEIPSVRIGRRLLIPTAQLRRLLGENDDSLAGSSREAA